MTFCQDANKVTNPNWAEFEPKFSQTDGGVSANRRVAAKLAQDVTTAEDKTNTSWTMLPPVPQYVERSLPSPPQSPSRSPAKIPSREGSEVSALLARLAEAESSLHMGSIELKNQKDDAHAEVVAMKRDYEYLMRAAGIMEQPAALASPSEDEEGSQTPRTQWKSRTAMPNTGLYLYATSAAPRPPAG